MNGQRLLTILTLILGWAHGSPAAETAAGVSPYGVWGAMGTKAGTES